MSWSPDQELVAALQARFGALLGESPRGVFFAPGRVNLMGGHVDYHGGAVLPWAVDLGVYLACSPRKDRQLRLASLDFEEDFTWDLDRLPAAEQAGWSRYPLGVVQGLRALGLVAGGMNLVFAGNLPLGGGLSSSAAISVVTAAALVQVHDWELSPVEIASLAHRSETEYVGVACGIMDPFASALAEEGLLLYLRCADRSYERVALPESVVCCVLDSMSRHDLADGSYNERVRESKAALAKLQQVLPGLRSYQDLRSAQLDGLRFALSDPELRRARHVVQEMARVPRAVEALRRADLFTFGELMHLSHFSARHLYEISTDRLDTLQAAAAGQSGVYGARVTGAGFGGCVVALVHAAAAQEVCQAVARDFKQHFGIQPTTRILAGGRAPGEISAS